MRVARPPYYLHLPTCSIDDYNALCVYCITSPPLCASTAINAGSCSGLSRAGDDNDKAAGAASRGPSYNSQEAGEASSLSTKHADMQGRGSGFAQAQVRVGMEGSVESGGGGESAALRALVKKLPDLSYMLSDSLVLPPRTH